MYIICVQLKILKVKKIKLRATSTINIQYMYKLASYINLTYYSIPTFRKCIYEVISRHKQRAAYIEQLENMSDYINVTKAHKSLYSASVSNVSWQLTSRSVV